MSKPSEKSKNTDHYFSLEEVRVFFEQPYSNKYKTEFSFDTLLEKSNEITFSEGLRSSLTDFSNSVNSNKQSHNGLDELPGFDKIAGLVDLIFLGYQGMAVIGPPFSSSFVIPNPAFKKRIMETVWEVNLDISQKKEQFEYFSNFNQLIYILNNFYGQNIKETTSRKLVFRNKKTGLKKYYKIESNRNFIGARIKGDLPQLSEIEISELINNYSETLFEEKFGFEKFTFYGFEISNFINITKIEAINEFRYRLLNNEDQYGVNHLIKIIQSTISSILNLPTVYIGITFLEPIFDTYLLTHSLSGLVGKELLHEYMSKGHVGKAYKSVFHNKTTVSIEKLSKYKMKDCPEKLLFKNGYKSAILIPVMLDEENISLIVEIGVKEENIKFGNYTVLRLNDFIKALQEVFHRERNHFQQRISEVVQHQFTSIHPCVYWKFEQAATKYLSDQIEGQNSFIQPITFNHLNTMYGQADIVGSSTLRNTCIQKDLLRNLKLLKSLFIPKSAGKKLHLVAYYVNKINRYLEEIQNNFVSAHESEVVAFINKEAHPYLKELNKNNIGVNREKYKRYLEMLDEEYEIIYQERRKFENSVSRLNSLLADFIEKEDARIQELLPHYFEKYTTDGIEYNIYLGQELLNNQREFTKNDLSNFRIWQLEMMCKLVRIVEKNKENLPIPLSTAQLIFIYNQPLSIQFRMEEKKFDVEGAYNIRYEILKKRIDKATIKGTKERLTVEDKIAIVYLSEDDKREYIPYMNYLIDKGFIESEVENLELNNLKGAEGLRALRIRVKQE